MSEYSKYEVDFMKEAASFPITWKEASGSLVFDDTGKTYIDFSSGIFVTNVGHSNIDVKKAMYKQITDNMLFTFSYPTKVRKEFVDKLMSVVPKEYDKVALYSTGSGAVDRAVQIARRKTGKKYVLNMERSFHGNTGLLMDISKSFKYEIPFPLSDCRKEQFYKDIKFVDPDEICAFLLEGYQGWSAYFYPEEYIQELVKWCKENDILVIFDEVQSGFMRTGPMFTFEDYGVIPDMVCFGKACSGGLPLSGILSTKDIMSCMKDEKFSSTHSGNTFILASAIGNLKALEKIDSKEIVRLGELMMNHMKQWYVQFPFVEHVTGKGLISAIHFTSKDIAQKVALKCLDKGLMLVNTNMNTIKIGPALNIPQKLLTEGLDIIEKSMEEIENENYWN